MTSENPHSQSDGILIPVQVDDVDRLAAVARHFDGVMLVFDAASAGSPAFEAVSTILRPIHDQLGEFKNWFNKSWLAATGNV